MEVIKSEEITVEWMQRLFQSKGYVGKITEVSPARNGLRRDAFVEIDFPGGLPVLMWVPVSGAAEIFLRVILMSEREKQKLDKEDLVEFAEVFNQNAQYFGAFSPISVVGMTLEYRLPCDPAVFDETLVRAVEQMADGGRRARVYIDAYIEG